MRAKMRSMKQKPSPAKAAASASPTRKAGPRRPTQAAQQTTQEAALADLNNRLFFRLLQVANTLNTQATKLVDPLGITSQQWSVIGALSRYQEDGGISVNELSQYLRVSRQNISEILKRLERGNLIRRTPGNKDSRERMVALTPTGLRLWNTLRNVAKPFHASALHDFNEAERHEFLDMLIKLERGLHGS